MEEKGVTGELKPDDRFDSLLLFDTVHLPAELSLSEVYPLAHPRLGGPSAKGQRTSSMRMPVVSQSGSSGTRCMARPAMRRAVHSRPNACSR